MTAADRAQRTAEADAACTAAYAGQGGPDSGAALVAVGGYGRKELAPCSDLDVVLVLDAGVEAGEWAEKLWYPLWDAGHRLDHAVRSLDEMVKAADGDLKVALGLLDVRHVAGDPNLTLRLRTEVLAAWRRQARDRLPALAELVEARHRLVGELAHLSVPDLKEAEGGIRDATVLKALTATWLVDVPHADLERCRGQLLDVRDALHAVARRGTDRVAPELWDPLADALGHAGGDVTQQQVRELGRRMAHLSRLTWRRVDAALSRPAPSASARRPDLVPLAPGIALSSGEVVLTRQARPAEDPLLLLRAAALAAERDAVLSPATAGRLAREGADLPDPWPAGARQLLVRLLAARGGLQAVWETLDETGALARLLPEWERIRLLPHASEIHRFTVDRHVVETCVEAGALIRRVARPDVLLVAALLHDIGKGGLTEHSVAGEPIARDIAGRLGFDDHAVATIGTLVRRHLLLSGTATTRDPDDPATIDLVARCVGDEETLDLLLALTEADARATAPKAWSTWRAGLVTTLAGRVRASLQPGSVTPTDLADADVPVPEHPDQTIVEVAPAEGGSTVTVVAIDRIGLLADAAAVLALQRAPVRAARAWAQGPWGVSVWDVADDHLDPAVLRQRLEAVAAGRVDPSARLRPPSDPALAPVVVVHPDASSSATVLEVRAADRPGTVHLVCAALADLALTVRSAHVDTLGPQAVDVFYVQEEGAGALTDKRAAAAAHAVREALTGG
ncbi:[protein-PII] uridylyltransferase [Nocardioides sp. GCM10027113]|uniref:[protein-PII] uridylyltransferase n=1 Tax=unclassified Nocardioides TaxID=2615069 RepID=UPI003619F737